MALVIALLVAGEAQAQTAVKEAPPARQVRNAAYVGDRLWIRTDRSDLSFVTSDGRSGQVLDGFVDGICVRDHHLLVLFDDQQQSRWRLRRWTPDGWREEATLPYGKEEGLGALECQAERTTLVTTERIVRLDGAGAVQSLPLPPIEGRAGFTGALSDTGEAVYYGLSAGEFRGGGLVRVDGSTGEAAMIDASQRPGWRHLDLTPTMGLAASPLHKGCVIAAMGQDHGSGWGNLSEVCGSTVRALYVKPFSPAGGETRAELSTPYQYVGFSVPFYDLKTVAEVVWARARDGIYRMDHKGVVTFLGKPTLRRVGDFWVNFDNPQAAFVHPQTVGEPSPYWPLHVAPRQ